jgi:hypothetical protein
MYWTREVRGGIFLDIGAFQVGKKKRKEKEEK